jgi:excinuclease ABC subunit C
MKDRFGTVIYVGKARDLRKRVSSYFQPSRRHGWDLKLNALVDAIHDLDTFTVRSEPEAMLLEGKLIKEYQPRYNISFRDDKRFLLIKVNENDPIPRFCLTRIRQNDGARYFGPFVHSASARHTLTLARRKFNLRGCRPLTPGGEDYKHCLYGHLKYCTAPCIGNVSSDEYHKQVAAACEFLSGQTEEIERELEGQMKKAALALNFEKAAEYRDALADLRRTTEKVKSFPRIPYTLPVAKEPQLDLAELGRTLNLPSVPMRIEGFDISNISGTFAVASLVSFWDGRPDRANYRRFRMKTVVGQNDFACMGEVIQRRYSRLAREEAESVPAPPANGDARQNHSRFPDLIVIDGGKGQLGVAFAELSKLGLERIPVIGLAKEFEEIFQVGQSEPLRLSMESGALKLLQRIRDESHRFANTYNAQLRLKKISESILDEFPGIGGQRKTALLKKFGSVRRLRLATEEEIAAVAGFGGKTAADLKAFLAARPDTGAKPVY